MNDNEIVLSEMINIIIAIEKLINGFTSRSDTSEQSHHKLKNRPNQTLRHAAQTKEMQSLTVQLWDREAEVRRCNAHLTGVPERGKEERDLSII